MPPNTYEVLSAKDVGYRYTVPGIIGLRCGGMTSAYGSAHIHIGQGCRQTKAVNATVLPRSALIPPKQLSADKEHRIIRSKKQY